MTLKVGSELVKLNWYVYLLRESDTGKIRYIGKTLTPCARYYQHLQSAEPSVASKVRRWSYEVQARGATIHMRILAVCESDSEACGIEHALITGGEFQELVNSVGIDPPGVHAPKPAPKPLPPAPAKPELPGAGTGLTIAERVRLATAQANYQAWLATQGLQPPASSGA